MFIGRKTGGFVNTSLVETFEELHHRYNRREFIHHDPLEFLYMYNDPEDREIVGIVASSLAYGRVNQILKSVSSVLGAMGPSPYLFIRSSSRESLLSLFSDFKHRFSTGTELALTLVGTKLIIEKYGSLKAFFLSGMRSEDETVLPALLNLARELNFPFNGDNTNPGKKSNGLAKRGNSLIPSHEKKSPMKRLNLFLRWMVRRDDVDPGGWEAISSSKLLIPLDTHMHRLCLATGITNRKVADMRTVLTITESFREISPNDPVKYDFALTRPGILGIIHPWN